ncbi:MAG: hypothetical protein K6A23_08810 [Butyrivibrio sp.]|nr:hypothetical protein [Butyrivibrio sp.]
MVIVKKLLILATYILFFMIIFNGMDLLFDMARNTEFVFDFKASVLNPLVLSLVIFVFVEQSSKKSKEN